MSGPEPGLAALVRQALREALPEVLPELLAAARSATAAVAPKVEPVRVRDDCELAAFAARVLAAADDVRAGRLVFRLDDGTPACPADAPTSSPVHPPAPAVTGHRVERGAVTERHVRAAEAAGGLLVLGPHAVLTPLARDRIRAAGVRVVDSPERAAITSRRR